jgi:uncharacterized protein (TIGR00296 family)
MLLCILLLMLTLQDGTKAVQFARQVIHNYVGGRKIASSDLGRVFQEKQGVFVTLHTFPDHELRGCIGIPLPVMSLQEAIVESAQSVTQDPRFPPLQESELDAILVEMTVLTKPELIKVKQPKDYMNNIQIGRDGLIVEHGFYKGLLLPQVPVEQGWDLEEYLSQTCMKAGAPADAWFEKTTRISKFQGQIFTEVKPHGPVQETRLDGSHS